MCNEIVDPVNPASPKYDVSDLCCGGSCLIYTTCSYGETTYGCPEEGPGNPCLPENDCAADVFITPEQISCIGHQLDCEVEE
jgi:hypothetical protein